MKKCCFIIPYFGTLPNYFECWYQSALNNKKTDFLLITDQNILVTDNIKVINMTFNEFREFVKKKLNDKNIKLDTAYKICDYRPAFGKIFEENLREYAYWGYTDLDLVFGDLEYFLRDVLEKGIYDKLFQNGHMTILKNNERNNSLFLEEGSFVSFKKVSHFSKNFIFDEDFGIGYIAHKTGLNIYKKNPFADVIKDSLSFRYKIGKKMYEQCYFIYDNGKLFSVDLENNINEIMYVHLQKRKMENDVQDYENFYIYPNKFSNSLVAKKIDAVIDEQYKKEYQKRYKNFFRWKNLVDGTLLFKWYQKRYRLLDYVCRDDKYDE